MSDQNYLDALQEERRGYEIRGLSDRLKQVDAEIARVKRAMGVADVTDSPVGESGKQSRVTRRNKVG
mgnify:CR=1 FL=1